jgi:glycosyltransferase involved in cell wall biosynthesis
MRVTAAITTYNRARLVVEAVESVLAQTFTDFELLVIDDGSTDDTRERLAPYASRIVYVAQENRGRAGARNTALERAGGGYIGFLDSDDLWLSDKLERQVPLLDRDSQVGLVHGPVEMIDDAGNSLPEQTRAHQAIAERAHRSGTSYAAYCSDCVCLTSATLMRVDALRALGGYDTSFAALEDLDLYLRLAAGWKIEYMSDAPLAKYRSHGGQTDLEDSTRSEIQVCLKHLELLVPDPAIPARRLARRNLYLRLAACHHRLADARGTRKWMSRAIRLDPRVLFRTSTLRAVALSLVPRVTRLRERKPARATTRQ